jgi:hypothetical protein
MISPLSIPSNADPILGEQFRSGIARQSACPVGRRRRNAPVVFTVVSVHASMDAPPSRKSASAT